MECSGERFNWKGNILYFLFKNFYKEKGGQEAESSMHVLYGYQLYKKTFSV